MSLLREALVAECTAAGLTLTAEELELAQAHGSALLAWNARANVTRITAPREVARRHFVESFLSSQLYGKDAETVLDVGSGGGFPGLAARIVRRDVRLTLLEPRSRKAALLRRIAALHPEPRPVIHATRLEQFHVERPFSVVTFRGLHLSASDLLRHLAPEGRIVAFPGGDESWSAGLDEAGLRRVAGLPLGERGRQVVAWARAQ